MAGLPPGPQYPQGPWPPPGDPSQGYPQGPYQPNYYTAGYGAYGAQPPRKQSGVGVASFIVGLLVVLGLAALFIGMVVVMVQSGRRNLDESTTTMIGGAFMVGAFISLIGLGLGIGCLYDRQRKKVLGIIGLILNATVVVGVVVLLIIGLSIGS